MQSPSLAKVGTVGRYNIFVEKGARKVVAHSSNCFSDDCRSHDLVATRRDIQLLALGKKRRLKNYKVAYPRKGIVQIGCTAVRMSLVKKLAAKLARKI